MTITKKRHIKITAVEFYSITNVYVTNSTVAGRGVFAKRNIKKGSTVEVSPALRIVRNANFLMYTDLKSYVFEMEGDDATYMGLGYIPLYNHAHRPNAEFHVADGMIYIMALRNIKAHEEIFVNYGWDIETLAENGIV